MPTTQMLRGRKLCTFVGRDSGEDPVPSAVRWQRCLAIEVDTPWRKELTESAACPPEVAAAVSRYEAGGGSVRIQGLMRDSEYSISGRTRVIDTGPASTAPSRGESTEYLIPTDLTGGIVDALLNGGGASPDPAQFRRELSGVRDILVCTHGSRDACCARFGYEIYRRLRDEYAPASDGRLRVWRTSHTGGHRFAPTLIDLPDGRYWAWVRPDMLDSLVHREGPLDGLIDHYRGLGPLRTPFEQVAEREAFGREGWPWAAWALSSRVVGQNDATATAEVLIDFDPAGDAPSGTYAARVRRLDDVVTHGCASAELGKTVTADQYAVESFERLS